MNPLPLTGPGGALDEWDWDFWKHQTDKQITELFLNAYEHYTT